MSATRKSAPTKAARKWAQLTARDDYQRALGCILFAIDELKEAKKFLEKNRKTRDVETWIAEKLKNAGGTIVDARALCQTALELRDVSVKEKGCRVRE